MVKLLLFEFFWDHLQKFLILRERLQPSRRDGVLSRLEPIIFPTQ